MGCPCKEKKIKKLPKTALSSVKVSIYPGCCKQYEEEFSNLIEALNLLPCEYYIFDELPCCSHNVFAFLRPQLAVKVNINSLEEMSKYSNVALTSCSSCFLCFKETLKVAYEVYREHVVNPFFKLYNSFTFLYKFFFRYLYTALSFYQNKKILFLIGIHNILGEDRKDIFYDYLMEFSDLNIDIFEYKYFDFNTLRKYKIYKEPFDFYVETLKKVKEKYDLAISFSSLNTFFLKQIFKDFIKDIWKEIANLKYRLG